MKNGVYHENLGIRIPIRLIGENMYSTIIDGNTSQSYRVPINIFCFNVTVSGFTLSYGYAGIQFQREENCTISENMITNGQFGIRGGNWNKITDNIFEKIGLGCAIRFDGSSHNIVQRNFINFCTEGVQVMWGSHYNTITENTILDCNDVEIRLQESDRNSVSENTVRNNGVGISIYIDNTNLIQRPKNRALHQETLTLCSFLLKIIENNVTVKIMGRIIHDGNSGISEISTSFIKE